MQCVISLDFFCARITLLVVHLGIPPKSLAGDSSRDSLCEFLQILLHQIFSESSSSYSFSNFENFFWEFLHECLLWIPSDFFMDLFEASPATPGVFCEENSGRILYGTQKGIPEFPGRFSEETPGKFQVGILGGFQE